MHFSQKFAKKKFKIHSYEEKKIGKKDTQSFFEVMLLGHFILFCAHLPLPNHIKFYYFENCNLVTDFNLHHSMDLFQYFKNSIPKYTNVTL